MSILPVPRQADRPVVPLICVEGLFKAKAALAGRAGTGSENRIRVFSETRRGTFSSSNASLFPSRRGLTRRTSAEKCELAVARHQPVSQCRRRLPSAPAPPLNLAQQQAGVLVVGVVLCQVL